MSASGDNTIKLYELITGRCIKIFNEHKFEVFTFDWEYNSNKFASGSRDCTIKIWDIMDKICL